MAVQHVITVIRFISAKIGRMIFHHTSYLFVLTDPISTWSHPRYKRKGVINLVIRFNFYLPESMLSGMMLRAEEEELSVAKCLRKAIKQYLSGNTGVGLSFNSGFICSGTILNIRVG